MSEQRSEKATPQKKKKAREGGDWVRSRELLSGASMLAGLLTLGAAGGRFTSAWKACYTAAIRLGEPGARWDATRASQALQLIARPVWQPLALVLAATFCVATAIGFAQSGGLQISGDAIVPKLSRLNPGEHIKRMFSARSLVRLAKSIVPAAAVAWLGWGVVQHATSDVPVMSLERLPQTFDAAYGLGVKAAWITVVWSALDYGVEWRAWSQRLRMSKQDVRQEMKEQGGNPQVKGKIRQIQRAMRKRKAKVDMRRATVLITNPTHYAVALAFSFDTMAAPTVLGKGRDLHALDMREEARWAAVPIVENPPLARSLYRSVEVGQPIPFELYAAIAGILAYLYREQNDARRRETATAAAPVSRRPAHSLAGFEGGV